MESVRKVLENFSSVIYPIRCSRYSEQDYIFIESYITNHWLKIKLIINLGN